MKTRLCLVAVSLLAFLSPAQATDRDKLLQLARTARFGEALEVSYKKVIRQALPNLTDEQLACYDDIRVKDFLEATADHLATFVDDDQWVIADKFYKSPLGEKWMANLDFVIQQKGQPARFTDEEKAQFAAFEATPVGAQLTDVRKVMSSAPVKTTLREILAERTAKCGRTPQGAQK